ncbi:MAG: hypothetical protein IT355_12075 [Gemmatimonadaceae bacterium]|nr:hypothetical protein [Gemmatimonadaceae bacterium]
MDATELPANQNTWALDTATRIAVLRHRRPLDLEPVALRIRFAELKALLAEILTDEALRTPKLYGKRTDIAEAKRRVGIILRKEAQAEFNDLKAQPPRSVLE